MNKALLLSLSLFLVALSGCTDDGGASDDLKDEFQEAAGEEAGETNETSNSEIETGEPAEPGNETGETTAETPEEGTIYINFSASTNAGEAPLTVNFSVMAKAINADGTENAEALFDWAMFDANENSTSGVDEFGSEMPANVTYTFDTAGNYSIVAGVTADGYESGFATIDITVGEVPAVERPTETFSCTTPAGLGAEGIGGQVLGIGGCNLGEVPAGTWEVMEVTIPDFCNIQAETTGDQIADEEATPGKTFSAGNSFSAFCEFGALESTMEIVISKVV